MCTRGVSKAVEYGDAGGALSSMARNALPTCDSRTCHSKVSRRGVDESGHGYNNLLKPAAGSAEGQKSTFLIPHGTLGSQGAPCFLVPLAVDDHARFQMRTE